MSVVVVVVLLLLLIALHLCDQLMYRPAITGNDNCHQ